MQLSSHNLIFCNSCRRLVNFDISFFEYEELNDVNLLVDAVIYKILDVNLMLSKINVRKTTYIDLKVESDYECYHDAFFVMEYSIVEHIEVMKSISYHNIYLFFTSVLKYCKNKRKLSTVKKYKFLDNNYYVLNLCASNLIIKDTLKIIKETIEYSFCFSKENIFIRIIDYGNLKDDTFYIEVFILCYCKLKTGVFFYLKSIGFALLFFDSDNNKFFLEFIMQNEFN